MTVGDPAVITSAGTTLIAQPVYFKSLSGHLAVNVNDPGKAMGYTLAVGGNAIAEAVTVNLQGNWPDYVFKKGYSRPKLQQVKRYIELHQHLPEIPAEQEVAEKGQNLGEMNKLLLKKVEELTLYLLEKDRQLHKLEKRVKTLEKQARK